MPFLTQDKEFAVFCIVKPESEDIFDANKSTDIFHKLFSGFEKNSGSIMKTITCNKRTYLLSGSTASFDSFPRYPKTHKRETSSFIRPILPGTVKEMSANNRHVTPTQLTCAVQGHFGPHSV